MEILSRAKALVERVTQEAFDLDVTFTSTSAETATIKALAATHRTELDSLNAVAVNQKDAHLSFAESVLLEATPDYPTRNTKGDVDMIDHLVSFADSTGTTRNYVISETWPDNTLGLVVCKLSERE